MCGEKISRCCAEFRTRGSPPRVRGKDPVGICGRTYNGITPACAGKRMSSMMGCLSLRDHPRVCGEKTVKSIVIRTREGSPPRVRGKAGLRRGLIRFVRITPACAGKSSVHWHDRQANKDHPRVCGEKHSLCSGMRRRRGSPPRVRGKVVIAHSAGWHEGITPACAGKSSNRVYWRVGA